MFELYCDASASASAPFSIFVCAPRTSHHRSRPAPTSCVQSRSVHGMPRGSGARGSGAPGASPVRFCGNCRPASSPSWCRPPEGDPTPGQDLGRVVTLSLGHRPPWLALQLAPSCLSQAPLLSAPPVSSCFRFSSLPLPPASLFPSSAAGHIPQLRTASRAGDPQRLRSSDRPHDGVRPIPPRHSSSHRRAEHRRHGTTLTLPTQ